MRRLRGEEGAREMLQVRAARVPGAEHAVDLRRETTIRQDPGNRGEQAVSALDALAAAPASY